MIITRKKYFPEFWGHVSPFPHVSYACVRGSRSEGLGGCALGSFGMDVTENEKIGSREGF